MRIPQPESMIRVQGPSRHVLDRLRWQRRYTAILLTADIAVVCGAVLLAQFIRFGEDSLTSGPEDHYATVYSVLIATLWLTVLAVIGLWHGDWQTLQLGNLSVHGWLWLAYLVLPVSLGVYPAYFWLLREVRPSLVSTFAFVNPVVALLLGFLILGEQLSLSAGLACLATLGGVSLIIFGRR